MMTSAWKIGEIIFPAATDDMVARVTVYQSSTIRDKEGNGIGSIKNSMDIELSTEDLINIRKLLESTKTEWQA